jgi:hypothetical protein
MNFSEVKDNFSENENFKKSFCLIKHLISYDFLRFIKKKAQMSFDIESSGVLAEI